MRTKLVRESLNEKIVLRPHYSPDQYDDEDEWIEVPEDWKEGDKIPSGDITRPKPEGAIGRDDPRFPRKPVTPRKYLHLDNIDPDDWHKHGIGPAKGTKYRHREDD